MTRTDIINNLVKRFGYQRYLEIGVQNPSNNFDRIKIPIKSGVDPDVNARATYCMTSDDFFEHEINKYVQEDKTAFDICFLDGLHHAEQVYVDIINSLKYLSQNGILVVHDCNPPTEKAQQVPRVQVEWNGDVWRAFVLLRETRPDLEMFVVDTDCGCGIIKRGKQALLDRGEDEFTYGQFNLNRKKWLNLKSVDEFKQWIFRQ